MSLQRLRAAAPKDVRGTTLLECVVALGLLAAAMTLAVQMLAWSAAQRKLSDQRQLALQEAANCLQRIRRLPWRDLSSENLDAMTLSEPVALRLPASSLRVWREQQTSDPPGAQIRVQVQWTSRHGTPLRVGLTTWRFQVEDAENAP